MSQGRTPRNDAAAVALMARLEAVDGAYVSLAHAERTSDKFRRLALDLLSALGEFVERNDSDNLALIRALEEAIIMANNGQLHPFFATSYSDQETAKPALSILAVQARAAAVLEFACADSKNRQDLWSENIVRVLGRSGLKHRGKDYSPDAVIKWRAACKSGGHKASPSYVSALDIFRDTPRATPESVLQCLANWCEKELGSALSNGNPHTRFSNRLK